MVGMTDTGIDNAQQLATALQQVLEAAMVSAQEKRSVKVAEMK